MLFCAVLTGSVTSDCFVLGTATTGTLVSFSELEAIKDLSRLVEGDLASGSVGGVRTVAGLLGWSTKAFRLGLFGSVADANCCSLKSFPTVFNLS